MYGPVHSARTSTPYALHLLGSTLLIGCSSICGILFLRYALLHSVEFVILFPASLVCFAFAIEQVIRVRHYLRRPSSARFPSQ